MASAEAKQICSKCSKNRGHILCGGCNEWMCMKHFNEHRQQLTGDMENLFQQHDQFFETLTKDLVCDHPLLLSINQWESKSIEQIKRMADDVRIEIRDHLNRAKTQMQNTLHRVSEQLKESRETEDFTEVELKKWKNALQELRQELDTQSNLKLDRDENLSPEIVRSLLMNDSSQTQWNEPIDVIDNSDDEMNFGYPCRFDTDNEGTVFVVNGDNDCVIARKSGATTHVLVAGGNGEGEQANQLNNPTAIVVDKKTQSLIISDYGNRRIVRWPCQNATEGEILITDVLSNGLALDDEQNLYVADEERDEVRKYRPGDKEGTVVAGGNGEGNRLDQLDGPDHIYVSKDFSVYVSDQNNHRIMKWSKDAKEGIIVAGERREGVRVNCLHYPTDFFVDANKTIFVIDSSTERLVQWKEGASEGVAIGGTHVQNTSWNHLSGLKDLNFDRNGNLYSTDYEGECIRRLQIIEKNLSA